MLLLPKAIRERRESLGLTREELAEKSGLSRNLIFLLETGKSEPRWGSVEKICAALDLPLWKAALLEEAGTAFPTMREVIQARVKGGQWRVDRHDPKEKQDVAEALADYVLRGLDQALSSQFVTQMRLTGSPVDSGWSPSQLVAIADVVESHFTPDDVPDLVKILQAVSELRRSNPARESKGESTSC